jgi:uncharacterized protein YeaO (DUF488 family)
MAERALAIKRVYDEPAPDDGMRVLVDRLWPRGLSKERARVDVWLRDVAPSDELRRWYHHEPERSDEFRRRYRAEVEREPARAALERLRALQREGPLTLVFAAKRAEGSNAAVLRDILAPER